MAVKELATTAIGQAEIALHARLHKATDFHFSRIVGASGGRAEHAGTDILQRRHIVRGTVNVPFQLAAVVLMRASDGGANLREETLGKSLDLKFLCLVVLFHDKKALLVALWPDLAIVHPAVVQTPDSAARLALKVVQQVERLPNLLLFVCSECHVSSLPLQ